MWCKFLLLLQKWIETICHREKSFDQIHGQLKRSRVALSGHQFTAVRGEIGFSFKGTFRERICVYCSHEHRSRTNKIHYTTELWILIEINQKATIFYPTNSLQHVSLQKVGFRQKSVHVINGTHTQCRRPFYRNLMNYTEPSWTNNRWTLSIKGSQLTARRRVLCGPRTFL
jgi:hypothetical protein